MRVRPDRPRPLLTAATAAWEELPALFFLVNAVGVLTLVREPPFPTFALAALFPLAAGFSLVSPGRRGAVALGLIALLGAQFLGQWLGRAAGVDLLDIVLVRQVFEFGNLLAYLLFALHACRTRGREEFVGIFGWTWLYGLVLENGGIWAGFFREPGYHLYLPGLPAPLATISGWCVVVYVAVWSARRVSRRTGWTHPLALGAVGCAYALALDLYVDPVATHFGWWIWHESLAGGLFHVPLVNFSAWIAALLPWVTLWFALGEQRRGLRLVTWMPVALTVALALVLALTWLLEGGDSAAMALFRAVLA